MTSKAADVSINAMGRGNLLKLLMTSQPTPLVGLKAAERVGRGTQLNGSSPPETATRRVLSSPSYSTSSESERESQPTPGGALLSRTGGAVSSSSDRDYFSSSGGDVYSRTLRHSPGGSVSAGSVGGSGQSAVGAVLQEHKSPQEASNISSATPETSPVQSLTKSRLPKHLKSSIHSITPAVSAPADFVIPNTNASNAQSLQKRSPVQNAKREVAMDRLD